MKTEAPKMSYKEKKLMPQSANNAKMSTNFVNNVSVISINPGLKINSSSPALVKPI
jgi:hypothetical protein